MSIGKERGDRLLEMIQMVLEIDALELEDESAILGICIDACKRKKIEVTEEHLAEMIRESRSDDTTTASE